MARLHLSIRSYLRLNRPGVFIRESRGIYSIRDGAKSPRQRHFQPLEEAEPSFYYQKSALHHDDCFSWIERQPDNSIHAVVTDLPCGL